MILQLPADIPLIYFVKLAVFVNDAIELLPEYQGVVGVDELFKAAFVALPVSSIESPIHTELKPETVGAGLTDTTKAIDVQPLVLV